MGIFKRLFSALEGTVGVVLRLNGSLGRTADLLDEGNDRLAAQLGSTRPPAILEHQPAPATASEETTAKSKARKTARAG